MDIIENLAGSLKRPPKWKGKNIDTIIEEAKKEYFAKTRKAKEFKTFDKKLEKLF